MKATNTLQVSNNGLIAVLNSLNKMKEHSIKRTFLEDINKQISQVSLLIIATHKINMATYGNSNENL